MLIHFNTFVPEYFAIVWFLFALFDWLSIFNNMSDRLLTVRYQQILIIINIIIMIIYAIY